MLVLRVTSGMDEPGFFFSGFTHVRCA
jgi:hypothetical protein